MRARYWSLLIYCLATTHLTAQCLTDFDKLLPEPNLDFVQDYGRSSAMYDDVLAVGAPAWESSGVNAGAVFLYKKVSGTWTHFFTITPPNPQTGLLFGSSLVLSQDYLLVSAQDQGGKIFIYKKPAGGWTNIALGTSYTELSQPNTSKFGLNSFDNPTMALSEDQQTLAVTDIYNNSLQGAVFVFHKQPAEEFTTALTPQVITSPQPGLGPYGNQFGNNGVAIHDGRIAIGEFGPKATYIYVYHDPGGTFNQFQLEATLTPTINTNSLLAAYNSFIFNAEGIFAQVSYYQTSVLKSTRFCYFQPSASGQWLSGLPTCTVPTSQADMQPTARLASNGIDLYVTYLDRQQNAYVSVLKKNGGGWCAPQEQIITTHAFNALLTRDDFGKMLSCNQGTDLVTGFAEQPSSPLAQLGILALSQQPDLSWTKQPLVSDRKTVAGNYFGEKVFTMDNFLFVGSIRDNRAKQNAGAVYVYSNTGSGYTRRDIIIPQISNPYDDTFGSSIAGYGDYLAVGATGFEPDGKVFIYKKKNADWSQPDLVQTLTLPDALDVQAFGGHMAMTDKWLAMTFAHNPSSFQVALCIFKLESGQWVYHQMFDIGSGDIFAKGSTPDVDIEGNTIVAGSRFIDARVYELNSQDQWEDRYSLRPSDPEYLHFIYPSFQIDSDGSYFGHSVDIDGDNIFVGAPGKDYNGKWNVGAVYVYTRTPGGSWHSGTETAKLLPRLKDDMQYFGLSVHASGNTLVVGAPNSEHNKDGTWRYAAGRTYVFQSKDYFWSDVIPLIDLTGDTFTRDAYGIGVTMNQNDLIIGASSENQASGAVYITPIPPVVKLVPPVCYTDETIDLYGYPFGGTWSGPGIIDAAQGIVDPKLVGQGKHDYIYKTPSCFYEGHLTLELRTGPNAFITTTQGNLICEKGRLSTKLSGPGINNGNYQWSYRQNSGEAFQVIAGALGNEWTATKAGEYQVSVNDGLCSAPSSPFTVSLEKIAIGIDTVAVFCGDLSPVVLKGTPSGGQWSGQNVTGNSFKPQGLSNGSYTVNYTYTSPAQCIYTATRDLQIKNLPTLNYTRSSDNLCNTGATTLNLTPTTAGLHYSWQMNANPVPITLSTNSDTPSMSIHENGEYQVRIANEYCSTWLPPYTVKDVFTLGVSPGGQSFSVCKDQGFQFEVPEAKSTDQIAWWFSEKQSDVFTVMNTTGSTLEVSHTGFYRVSVQRGTTCSFVSALQYVYIIPTDSVFIPNVFTPNNDGKNDIFHVTSTSNTPIDFTIFNRYGERVFAGDALRGWNGGEQSSGVYFWHVAIPGCLGGASEKKGTVHLVR